MKPKDKKSIYNVPTMIEATMPELEEEDNKLNLPTKIVEEVQNRVNLFQDVTGKAYAQFEVGDHTEIRPVTSQRFSRWLLPIGRELNHGNIPTSDSTKSVQNYLEALAFETPEVKLHNRTAKYEGEYWYDLTNENWQAIKISNTGWEVIDKPPALFKRQTHQKAQAIPKSGGDAWKIFDFVKVPTHKMLLTLVYIISCFIEDIAHPVPIIVGQHGSGKSMTMEFIRELIDPSQTPRLKIPKGDKDIVQTFDHHYAAFFDNLGILKHDMSDMICRVVTGEGTEYRALYTDDEAIIRSFRRCVMLNGINVPATKGDLLDRAIIIELEPFSENERRDEQELKADFKAELPGIFGGILDILVKSIKIYPSVHIKNLPRMADFAKWGFAIAEALNESGDEFLKSYYHDTQERVVELVSMTPYAKAILTFIDSQEFWTGTPSELLESLEKSSEMDRIDTNSSSWPKNHVWATRRLKEFQPTLKSLGIEVSFSKEGNRKITINKFTDSTGIPSGSTENTSKISKSISDSPKNKTVNVSMKQVIDSSKEPDLFIKPESDSDNGIDIKIPDLDGVDSHDNLSYDELWDMANHGDTKALETFRRITQKKVNIAKEVSK